MHDPDVLALFRREEEISDADIPSLFSRWCVNPDRYACMRDPGTPGAVGSAVSTLLQHDPQGCRKQRSILQAAI